MKISLRQNVFFFALLIIFVQSTELILRPNKPTCSVLVSSFDVLHC